MKLFYSNTDLVDRIVNKMNYGFISKEDLKQAGLMGLFQASKNFKESENVKFTTYATYYIIGEIKKELRENKLIKISKPIYKIMKIIKENENLGIDDIAIKYKLDRKNIIDAYFHMNDVSSLDKDNGDGNSKLLSLIPDKNHKTVLYDALESLADEDKQVIKLRYLGNYSQTDLVGILNLTQSKISRIEKKALQNMRKFLLSK